MNEGDAILATLPIGCGDMKTVITIFQDALLLLNTSSTTSKSIIEGYFKKISEIINKKQIESFISDMTKHSRFLSNKKILESNTSIDIKEDLLRFPVLLLSRLCTYYGIEFKNSDSSS